MQVTADYIGGRWKTVILWYLMERVHRFAELQRQVKGISQKVLIQQLRELERDGLVKRTVYPEVPPKVEYALTPRGDTLRPVIEAMCQWGKAVQASLSPTPPPNRGRKTPAPRAAHDRRRGGAGGGP